MGQTRVDLLHLLEDLRDAYPGALSETIVSETVANALDSGAANIAIRTEPGSARLAIIDDGAGMTRAQLRRYHDLASTSKRRGRGIGFAGVGIKLALLACDEVMTETRRGDRCHATSWHLASRHKAPWRYVELPGLVPRSSGTAVRLHLSNPLAELLDRGWLEAILRAHFAPLFEAAFDDVLAQAYPDGVRFIVDGRQLTRLDRGDVIPAGRVAFSVRLPRKRKPSAVGWLSRSDAPLPEDRRGVAVSTLGKVILRGWDWLGVAPATADRITGLVEAPALAEALTLNKADFVRTGARGAAVLAYRKAVQEAVSDQLAVWGDVAQPPPRRPRTRLIERDLEQILTDLADDFPLLGTLVERRPGGQRRIPLGGAGEVGEWSAAAALRGRAEAQQEPEPAAPEHDGAASPQGGGPSDAIPPETPAEAGATPPEAVEAELPSKGGRKRPGRYVLEIRFENRPDLPELGRLVESTVWVNEAHPAWRRISGSRAEGYHVALTTAMALAPLAAPPVALHAFITVFLERWGEAAEDGDGRERGRRKRGRARRRPG